MKKYRKEWIILIVLAVTCVLLWCGIFTMNSIGQRYRPASSPQALQQEMIVRTNVIAEKKDKVYFAAITPFVWDEGYYIDASMKKEEVDELVGNRIPNIDIASDQQRMVFSYNGKVIVDLTIDKADLDFDFDAGLIDVDLWLNIEHSDDGGVRLFE